MSEVPMRVIYAIVGALAGAVATLGAAAIRYVTGQDQMAIERRRMRAEIEDTLRDDLYEQYEAEREARQDAEERAEQAEARANELASKMDELRAELRRQQETLIELHTMYDSLAARIRHDSDVEWDPDPGRPEVET